MCVASCLRCVAKMLVSLSIICILANILLLLPGFNIYFLLEGHVTRQATWSTGIWSSGILVLVGARAFMTSSKTKGCFAFRTQMCFQLNYSALILLGSGFCSWVSVTGLVQGPLCLYNTSAGQVWGVPLQPYPDRSALQLLFTTGNLFNLLLGILLGDTHSGVKKSNNQEVS
ncbi:transmembrane 4 L6 family member 1 [Gadus chalcogrammus]|uniref:transmembrane 4 L6 family member 1 n=1 Tax=Gadus chalcogrammus TaxID=1042646 RepID=UPI0024C4B86F|nr:transmembrane 4 L6 family member 1 [Gadus chalcogrammus]